MIYIHSTLHICFDRVPSEDFFFVIPLSKRFFYINLFPTVGNSGRDDQKEYFTSPKPKRQRLGKGTVLNVFKDFNLPFLFNVYPLVLG